MPGPRPRSRFCRDKSWVEVCAIGSLVWFVVLPSCDRSSQNKPRLSPTEAAQALKDMKTEAEHALALYELYESYLSGSPEEAVAAMRAVNKYVPMLKHGREPERFFQYARLHCVTMALGDEDEAYLYFVKARYWRLAMFESEGRPSSAIAKSLREFTEYKCDRFVIEFDLSRRSGGAQYWRELPGGPVSPHDWLKKTYREEQ